MSSTDSPRAGSNCADPWSDSITRTVTGTRARVLLGIVGFAFFVDMLVYGMVVPALPSLAKPAGLEFFEVAAVFACYGLAYFALTPIVGWLVDRRGSRAVFLSGAVTLALATLFFGYATTPMGLVFSRTLQGAGAAANWVAGYAVLVQAFTREQRGRAVATASIGTALGVLLGPTLGGCLLEISGPHAPFWVAASLAAAAVPALAVALPRSTPQPRPRTGARVLQGRAVPWLLASLAAGLALGGVEATLPVDLAGRLHVSALTIGLLFALTAVAFIAASQIAGRVSDNRQRRKLLATGWVILGLALAGIGQQSAVLLHAVTLACLGTGMGMMIATIMPALIDVLEAGDAQHPGTAAAAYNLSYSAGCLAGAPLTGWVADLHSFRAATTFTALVTLGCGVLAALAQSAFGQRETKA